MAAQGGRRTAPSSVEIVGMTKRFGAVTALEDVSTRIAAGSFHALLGENGAGKSTLVKCLVGYHRPTPARSRWAARERTIRSPHDAHALGIGMVYQHFTLVPSMTVAENLVMARDDVPAVIHWRRERERLAALHGDGAVHARPRPARRAPRRRREAEGRDPEAALPARRFIILDEPTSVLTPAEADEVLGMLHAMTRQRDGDRADDHPQVPRGDGLRRRRHRAAPRPARGRGPRRRHDPGAARRDDGGRARDPRGPRGEDRRPGCAAAAPRLVVDDLVVDNDSGLPAVDRVSLSVRPGEIVGIAGVSGNGQRELVEALIGQRRPAAGAIRVNGKPYRATRGEIRGCTAPSACPRSRCGTPACPGMSVAENMALRNFDEPPLAAGPWLRHGPMRERARRLIAEFKVKTDGPDAPIANLSGGNVQRAVLARELSGNAAVLIAANPVFGLDFAAVAEIHDRILAARNGGAAVLLVSEDLDELLALSDRILVMFDGRIVHETPAAYRRHRGDRPAMAGHDARTTIP